MIRLAMPQMGETVTEGTITRWLKKPGDAVSADEALLEISTDKVDSEIPSPAAGFLRQVLVPEGETVLVGTPLAVITDTADEALPEADAPAPASPTSTASAPASAPAPAPVPAPAPTSAPVPTSEASPAPAPDPEPTAAATAATDPPSSTSWSFLSPAVRRLLSDLHIDPAEVAGTGELGRVTRDDVLAHVRRRERAATAPAALGGSLSLPATEVAQATSAEPAPSAVPAQASSRPVATAWEGDEVVAFSAMRRITAEHMVRSLATSAHTLIVMEVDYSRVDEARSAAAGRFREREGFGLSYLPFVARAAIDALREHPRLNAAVGDDQLIVRRRLNLGIAVDLDHDGLMVPVVHDADALRLTGLARSMHDLAQRARSRSLAPTDIADGTFTITNAGGYGTFITAPVINQPQVAILSTDGVRPAARAVPVEGADPDAPLHARFAIGVRPVGNLALSFDHRANDGAYAAAFLARVRANLEQSDWTHEL